MSIVTSQPDALWDIPILPSAAVVLTAAIYIRGWFRARQNHPSELPVWRLCTFLAALTFLFLALASPLDSLADDLLLFHMTQHILLMSVVPPLIALGAPLVPILWGLPRLIIRTVVTPLLRNVAFHKTAGLISTPPFALTSMVVAFVGWHIPSAYELALHSEAWHAFEHLSFLATSILFWWKIVDPWPTRNRWSPWTKLACLIAADVANTAVSAYLTFCGHVLYPSYAILPRPFAIAPLTDQSGAGAEMWVINSLAFLIPAIAIPMLALAPVRGQTLVLVQSSTPDSP